MKKKSNSILQSALIKLQHGESCRNVAKELKISITTTQRIRNRNKENIPPPKKGRPSKVTKASRKVLAREFDTGQLETIEEGQEFVESNDKVQVHGKTIKRYLASENVKAYVKQKRPEVTDDQRKARLKFAREHLHWTVQDWANVMFSDETMIYRVGYHGRKYYYKKKDRDIPRPHQTINRKQGGGGRMLIWGCMTYYGIGDACWVPFNTNSVLYVEILQDYIFNSVDYYNMDRTKFIFQQDNTSVHKSHTTMNYLRQAAIQTMVWPVNSPDLNPIELVWSYVKSKLSQYKDSPKDLDDLWERYQDIWNEIPMEYIRKLYEGMPSRMKEVIKNRGGLIKY